jgi:hypothetical protein
MSRNKNQSSNTSNKSNLNDSGNLDLDSELEKTHIHEDAEEVQDYNYVKKLIHGFYLMTKYVF